MRRALPIDAYTVAMAAAKDAADANRRREHRTTWSATDYRVAVDTFVRLFPLLRQEHP